MLGAGQENAQKVNLASVYLGNKGQLPTTATTPQEYTKLVLKATPKQT